MAKAGSVSGKTGERTVKALANAIIVQAAKDYRDALRRLNRHPNSFSELDAKMEIERFLRSDWFTMLTKVDPEMLITRLNKEVSEDESENIAERISVTSGAPRSAHQ
jgi:hypothetical protein